MIPLFFSVNHGWPRLAVLWPWWLTMVCKIALTMVHSQPWSEILMKEVTRKMWNLPFGTLKIKFWMFLQSLTAFPSCSEVINDYFWETVVNYDKPWSHNIKHFRHLMHFSLVFEVGGDVQKVAGESSCCHIVNMLFFYECSRGSTVELSELAGENTRPPAPGP